MAKDTLTIMIWAKTKLKKLQKLPPEEILANGHAVQQICELFYANGNEEAARLIRFGKFKEALEVLK
jgi:hypothetical protein